MKAFLRLLAVSAAVAHHTHTVSSNQQTMIKKLYDSIVTSDYLATLRPYTKFPNGTEAPTSVNVQLGQIKVIDVDTTRGFFTFQTFVRKEWTDSRLVYNTTAEVPYIPVSPFGHGSDRRCIWRPDLYILNGLDYYVYPKNFHGPNSRFITRIYPDGRVFCSIRVTETVACPALVKGSGKEVICPVQVGSFSYYDDELVVSFKHEDGHGHKDEGVTYVSSVVPGFTFESATAAPTCGTVKAMTKSGRSHEGDVGHEHDCVQVDFKFNRV